MPLSLANKIAILGVVVSIASVAIPFFKDDRPKDAAKPHQEPPTKQDGISVDNQSVVIQGNSGTISFQTGVKKEPSKR